MAKKDHTVLTQVVSVAGYSLSVMLLALACAMYFGWVSTASKQAGLENGKVPVPVVKSPDLPAKVKVAEPKPAPSAPKDPAVQVPSSTTETAETDPPVEQPDLPSEEIEQKPFDSARISPTEQDPLTATPEQDEETRLVPLPNVTSQEPEADPTPPDASKQADVPLLPDPSERPATEDTGEPETLKTAEDLTPKIPERVVPKLPPSGEKLAKTDDAKSFETDNGPTAPKLKTADGTLPRESEEQPASEPQKQARSEVGEPKVRIIAPPAASPQPKQSPSVVIRIEPEPTDDLDVLPRPKIVPKDRPKVVKRADPKIAKAPSVSGTQAKEPSEPVAIPRAKPIKRQTASAPKQIGERQKQAEVPRASVPETAASEEGLPQPKAPKTDALAVNNENDQSRGNGASATERAPKPMAKPARLVRRPVDPAHTATVSPRKERADRIRSKPRKQARAKPQRKRVRVIRPPSSEASDTKRQRTKLARNRIVNREGNRRLPSQSVSMDQDTYCLAIAIYYEAGRKNLQNQVVVSRDILHRVESGNFPNSVCEVVYQYAHRRGRCRYAFACDGLPDRPRNKSVWRRAKMLAKAQISCGSRCGCYLQKATLVSSSQGRKRRVIRCQAGYRPPRPTPTLRRISTPKPAPRRQIKTVSLRPANGQVSELGRAAR